MVISCIRLRDIDLREYRLIGRKSRNFYTPPVFSAPAGGDSVGISWRCLMLIKLEWLGYRMVKKNYDDMLSRFHTIPAWHGRTDRQTDGRTDRIAISISRVSISVLTRDKNRDAHDANNFLIFFSIFQRMNISDWLDFRTSSYITGMHKWLVPRRYRPTGVWQGCIGLDAVCEWFGSCECKNVRT